MAIMIRLANSLKFWRFDYFKFKTLHIFCWLWNRSELWWLIFSIRSMTVW